MQVAMKTFLQDRVAFSVYVTGEVAQEIKSVAQEKHQSIGATVRQAIEFYLQFPAGTVDLLMARPKLPLDKQN